MFKGADLVPLEMLKGNESDIGKRIMKVKRWDFVEIRALVFGRGRRTLRSRGL